MSYLKAIGQTFLACRRLGGAPKVRNMDSKFNFATVHTIGFSGPNNLLSSRDRELRFELQH